MLKVSILMLEEEALMERDLKLPLCAVNMTGVIQNRNKSGRKHMEKRR
jgi:hypothetical protein